MLIYFYVSVFVFSFCPNKDPDLRGEKWDAGTTSGHGLLSFSTMDSAHVGAPEGQEIKKSASLFFIVLAFKKLSFLKGSEGDTDFFSPPQKICQAVAVK